MATESTKPLVAVNVSVEGYQKMAEFWVSTGVLFAAIDGC